MIVNVYDVFLTNCILKFSSDYKWYMYSFSLLIVILIRCSVVRVILLGLLSLPLGFLLLAGGLDPFLLPRPLLPRLPLHRGIPAGGGVNHIRRVEQQQVFNVVAADDAETAPDNDLALAVDQPSLLAAIEKDIPALADPGLALVAFRNETFG